MEQFRILGLINQQSLMPRTRFIYVQIILSCVSGTIIGLLSFRFFFEIETVE